jgi:hypothetical protein
MKYKEMLNARTPQQIIKHSEIQERVLRSAMNNIKVVNPDSILYNRITKLVENAKTKERVKQLFK